MKKKSKDKKKKRRRGLFRRKRKKSLIFRFISLCFRGLSGLIRVLLGIKKQKEEYKDYDKKMISTRCNIISASLIALSVIFVYVEESLFYAYPIITCLVPFMKLSEGINEDIYNQYKDLKLYNRILKINLSLLVLVLFIKYEEFWFINYFMSLTFIVPLILGNLNREENWDTYNKYIRE